MCGIVAYFGNAANNLSRVLTGMSAIIYRAPDSTGVGLFGDHIEPVKMRKCVGSVIRLCEHLLENTVYPDYAREFLTLLNIDPEGSHTEAMQQRLLEFEGHSPAIYTPFFQKQKAYFSYSDLLDVRFEKMTRLVPGVPGNPSPIPPLYFRSRKDLENMVPEVIYAYDIPPISFRIRIRRSLSETLRNRPVYQTDVPTAEDLLDAFDRIFDSMINHDRPDEAFESDFQQTVFRYLSETPVHIPSDYDRDAVRCVFRLLDAALICRLGVMPELDETIEKILAAIWQERREKPRPHWKILYEAEKNVNIFGWAAAAVLAYLQKMELFPLLWKDSVRGSAARNFIRGETDPFTLMFLASPILSHGRWALQSSVSQQNAHPFCDAARRRLIVLNGQFCGAVETEIHDFLEKVGKYAFRTGNSSEYFALLWGYYFDNLQKEKRRYEEIHAQTDAGLSDCGIGSQTIDFQVYHQVKDTDDMILDEIAFLQAARQLIREGGQIAVAGISLHSPGKLYVAAHNRPVFLVYHAASDSYMAVSDINAALGLFPQRLIRQKTVDIRDLKKRMNRKLLSVSGDENKAEEIRKTFDAEEKQILNHFRVAVYPLEGEEQFVKIETDIENGAARRKAVFTDFKRKPLPEIEPFETVLFPAQIRKTLYKSFYETHLQEIPDRLRDALSYYGALKGDLPKIAIRDHLLRRRFGDDLRGIRRIFIAGMGSSYHAALMARPFFKMLFPDIDIVPIQPVEIDDLSRLIMPDSDLAILLSWSGTTADMVELAKELHAMNTVLVGVSEKVFADMSLIASRSAGVIPILSGEEVTVLSVKSPVCMLFVLNLFCLWLASEMNRTQIAADIMAQLLQVPDQMSAVLKDDKILTFARDLAAESAKSHACVVIGAMHSTGTSREAAMKLEENSWTAVGKPLDYRDFFFYKLKKSLSENLVIINATLQDRLSDALTVMRKLFLSKIPFSAVTFDHPDIGEIRYYSKNRTLMLPKLSDCLQPFMDLMFYYRFALEFGKTHGRQPDDFPRNRVKSVTSGRSRPKEIRSQASEFQLLSKIAAQRKEPKPDRKKETLWETRASFEWDKIFYRQMNRLAKLLPEKNLLKCLLDREPDNLNHLISELGVMLFEKLPDEGEIILAPFDRAAEGVARMIAGLWQRYLKCSLRVALSGESPTPFQKKSLFILMGTREPDARNLSDYLQSLQGRCLWFGAKLSDEHQIRQFEHSLGYFVLSEYLSFVETCALYSGISQLIIRAWKIRDPERGKLLENHFSAGAGVISGVLNDKSLHEEILAAMKDNRKYQTAFFITSHLGMGQLWTDISDQAGSLTLQSYPYGVSVHGPLVTVDDRAKDKFVKISAEGQNTEDGNGKAEDGKKKGKKPAGGAKKKQDSRLSPSSDKNAFYADGNWFLPVLKEDYDVRQDNLIMLDMTGESFSHQAMDELSSYGCRNARIIIIVQETHPESIRRILSKYPIGSVIQIRSTDGKLPVHDFHLPFAMTMIGMKIAAAASEVRKASFEPASKQAIFYNAFGKLGKIMLLYRIDICHLDYRLIESVRKTSSMVEKTVAVIRFHVKNIRQEAELELLSDSDFFHSREEITDRFNRAAHSDAPFFIIRQEADSDFVKESDEISQMFFDNFRQAWHEPYGNDWKVIHHRILGMRETPDGKAVLIIPVMDRESPDGWLYYIQVRFKEWHHRRTQDEIRLTAEAAGRQMVYHDDIPTRYLKITSRFNEQMMSSGQTWDDRLLLLIRRPLLFQKTSGEIAATLASRLGELLTFFRRNGQQADISIILNALENTWESLSEIEHETDERRWEIQKEAVEQAMAIGSFAPDINLSV